MAEAFNAARDSSRGTSAVAARWATKRPGGRPVPLIDRIHRLMQLWKNGDVHKVDEYLDEHGLRGTSSVAAYCNH